MVHIATRVGENRIASVIARRGVEAMAAAATRSRVVVIQFTGATLRKD